ncbi:MAG: hypothetical protein QOJ28_1361 [Mycobacterium sp.]|nr:hypothetical protein [Mycobacterium sp.]
MPKASGCWCDSWQLMSNDDVPRDSGKFPDQQKGGFDRLPDSVQKILEEANPKASTPCA